MKPRRPEAELKDQSDEKETGNSQGHFWRVAHPVGVGQRQAVLDGSFCDGTVIVAR